MEQILVLFKGTTFKIFAIIFLFWILIFYITGRNWFRNEIEANEKSAAPSVQQLHWHIQHMREDFHMLVVTNYIIMCILLCILLFK
jgi:hypothetical protein